MGQPSAQPRARWESTNSRTEGEGVGTLPLTHGLPQEERSSRVSNLHANVKTLRSLRLTGGSSKPPYGGSALHLITTPPS